jgi:hypothetical protein
VSKRRFGSAEMVWIVVEHVVVFGRSR